MGAVRRVALWSLLIFAGISVVLWLATGYWVILVGSTGSFSFEARDGSAELSVMLLNPQPNSPSRLEMMVWHPAGFGYQLRWWDWSLQGCSTDITVRFPFWFLLAMFLVPAALLRYAGLRGDRRAPKCAVCGYDLRGLPEPRCPECGTCFKRVS